MSSMTNFFKWGRAEEKDFSRVEILLESLQSRDDKTRNEAAKYVIKHYKRKVTGYLYSLNCFDSEVRDDIFYAALTTMADPKTKLTSGTAKFETIINTFAYYQLLNVRKSRTDKTELPISRVPSGKEGVEADGATVLDVLAQNGSAFDRTAGEEDEDAEAVLLVRQALKMLAGKHCRKIFELKYYHGLTQEDIAEELGLVRVTVSNLNGKCMEELKAILRELGMRMPGIDVRLKDIGKKGSSLAKGDSRDSDKQGN